MSMLASALAQVADHGGPESLETFRSHIDPEALRRIGATRRCASERMENRDVGLKL